MARIPEDELQRLKRETDLAALVRASGVELAPHGSGGDLVGRCPFHDDRTPSLVITPSKGLWHCLGACGVGGSAIDWVMRVRKVSFRHAVEVLRAPGSPCHGGPAAEAVAAEASPSLELPPIVFDAEDRELMVQVVDYYHQRLVGPGGAEARAHLAKRGIEGTAQEQAIERFRLGFADRTLGLRLPEKQVKAGREIRERLQKLGLYRESGHEHFNGCVVFPVLDSEGQVVEMYGRKIGTRLRKGTPLHLYLPGPHAGVWNHEALDAGHDEGLGELPGVIVCESIIDALTFWCAGYRHVIASYGVQGFTDEHLAGLRRWAARGGKRVFIAYDRDEAGQRGAEKLGERLLAELPGIECRRVQFPKGMDANEYALKVKPADKSLGLVLRKAEWLGQASGGDDGVDDGGRDAPAAEAAAKEDSAAASTAPPSTSSPASASSVPSSSAAPAPAPSASLPSPASVPESSSSAAAAPAPSSSSASPPPEPSCPPVDAPPADTTPSSLAAIAAPGSAASPAEASPAPSPPPSPSSSSSPSSPRPPSSSPQAADDLHEGEGGLVLMLGDRRYRVRGLEKNLSYDLLKVNLFAARGDAIHVDTFDLYAARPRQQFIQAAARELEVEEAQIKADLGRLLLKLEAKQEQLIQEATRPREQAPTRQR